MASNIKADYIVDTIVLLDEWAETFRDLECETYDHIVSLCSRLVNNNCTEEDYDDILFHLWQQRQGE